MNKKENDLLLASLLLKKDQLVAIPTETVYGLAANGFSDNAIRKIFSTKNRPDNNPLIFHIKNMNEIFKIAKNIPEIALKLGQHFWPGPLTLVLEKQDYISSLATANKTTVGIRIPNHPLTLALLQYLDFPLVAPSANRSNHISPTCPEHVEQSLKDKTPFILDGGRCENGIESTIVGFNQNQIVLYRHGAISKEEIESFLGFEIEEFQNESSPLSPGMFKKHYSPNTYTIATHDIHKELSINEEKNLGIITFQKDLPLAYPMICLSKNGDLHEAAAQLYFALHQMDSLKLDLIIIEFAPNSGLGKSINDRILRASQAN